MKKIFSLALIMAIITMLVIPMAAFADGSGKTNKVINYVALGDSLTAGQTPFKDANGNPQFDKGYVDTIVDGMRAKNYDVNVKNTGISALTSDGLKEVVNNPVSQAVLKEANIITITIGANDMLRALDTTNFSLKEGVNPQVLLGTINANLSTVLKDIQKINGNAKVYVMGYYNPFALAITQLPEETKQGLLSLLKGLNTSIYGAVVAQVQSGQSVTYVPTSEVIDANASKYLPNPKDVHLSKDGYKVVGELFLKAMNLPELQDQLTIPNVELPSNHPYPIARLHVRQSNVPLLKKEADGSFTKAKMLKRGEFYRVYGVEGMYYNVGGQYFIRQEDKKMSVIIGRIIVKQDTALYAADGTIKRTIKKGEAIRVYSYDNEVFQVGGGYYMYNSTNVKYYVGYLTINKDTTLYKPNGNQYSTLKAGHRYKVYNIDGNKFNVGGNYYVIDHKSSVSYMKN